LRRAAAGSIVAVFCDAFFCVGCDSAFDPRWVGAFAATRAGAPALRESGVGCGSGSGVGLICSFFDSIWRAEFGVFDQVLAGVVGDFTDYRLCHYSVVVGVEADIFCVPCGDAQGLNDGSGAGCIERAFDQPVDYVHDRKLDGLAVFEQGHGVEMHVDALLHAFDDAGMKVTEELAAQGGRSAALSGHFDVGAITNVGMGW
jgi:hypothetical protein